MDKYRGNNVIPECPHFGECGGCMLQDISYDNQLLLKREYLNGLLAGIAEIDIVNGYSPYRYRNRMDMVTAFGRTGLRKAGNFRSVVDITTCLLMQKRSEEMYRAIRNPLQEVEGYDYLAHRGYLRYAVVRQGMFTGEVMVNFVTAARVNNLQRVIDTVPGADSISILHNEGLADTSFGEPFITLRRGYIKERFDDITFRITPNSFFQSNSSVALIMYRRIRESVRGKVLDLYSGVGSITLFIAGRADHVTGVEQVGEAVECARSNGELNEIGNVEFLCSDARSYLREKASSFDTVVMDPPRSGIHPKMVRYLNETGPDALIYMSCNPATFAVDAMNLERYTLQWIEAYDMFPQTPHMETLAMFKRK